MRDDLEAQSGAAAASHPEKEAAGDRLVPGETSDDPEAGVNRDISKT
jgi:hypothetical protein